MRPCLPVRFPAAHQTAGRTARAHLLAAPGRKLNVTMLNSASLHSRRSISRTASRQALAFSPDLPSG